MKSFDQSSQQVSEALGHLLLVMFLGKTYSFVRLTKYTNVLMKHDYVTDTQIAATLQVKLHVIIFNVTYI